MGNSDDAAFGIIVVVALALWGLWVIFMFIMEYFVFFLILGLIIWALYYYFSNVEGWEKEKKMKDLFCKKNSTNHSNYVALHKLAIDNIKALRTSPLNHSCSDSFNQMRNQISNLNQYSNSPSSFFNKNKSVNHNPYSGACVKIKQIIEKTTELPVLIENINKKYKKLKNTDILQSKLEPFEKVLLNFGLDLDEMDSSLFEITDDRRVYHHSSYGVTNSSSIVDVPGM